MLENLKKPRTLIAISLALTLLISVFYFPTFAQYVSMLFLLVSIGMATILLFKKHWETYQQAECTREKMIRNLSLDIIGFTLTMTAAMYVGRLAGGYVGLHSGFWIGLLAGFLGGFAAAWVVRSVWGRLIRVEV